jgi:uncharacterized lipoprotein YmbA
LAANWALLLPADQVYLSAWERGQVTVAVFVEVEQFEVDLQGLGTLAAQWRLSTPGHDQLAKSGQVRLTRAGAPPRANPQAIAATLSDLIAQFSRRLAPAIRESTQTKPLNQ